MVRLVKNKEASGQHRPQPFAQWICISWVNQEVVGDQKAAVGTPWIHTETAFAAHSCQIRPIEDLEDKPETLL
ncbi:hypothetical protein ACFL3F_03575 [Planctomycetota bacterium]